ncbi:MFS general substrate transporter [Hortaea werneckii]|nr:MFS general substrate transporter [Hortaea werneckii]
MSSDLAVPGTVRLIDAAGVLHAAHGSGQKEIVLVPQPTDTANDPLRWSKARKVTAISIAVVWCFFIGAMISGLSPAYNLIQEDTGISVADLSTGNGLMYLFMGWGAVVTQRIALDYGRRVTLVASAILVTAMTIWTAFVGSKGEFFANRVLLGTFTSPQETLMELIVGDLYFTHERGAYLSLYAWSLFAGAFLSPVAAGYVADELGWRWIQYILTMIGVGLTLVTFLCFEETMFHRTPDMFTADGIEEPAPDMRMEQPSHDIEERGLQKGNAYKPRETSEKESPSSIQATPFPAAETSRTFAERLKLWGYRHPAQPSSFKAIILPFKLLSFPAVFVSGLLVGGILSWYNVLGGSLALVLGNPPYNFSADSVGLTYLASLVGVSIGCLISGWPSDKLVVFLARRNGGVMEPEQRLWLCSLALLIHPAGCLLYGVGAAYHIHWFAVVFGQGLICVTLPMGSTLAYTYVMDSYGEMAGDGIVSTVLVRNAMGFAFGYAVVRMINALTLRYAFVLIAVLGEAVWAIGMLMILVGKPMRRDTAQRYWNLVEETGATAH